MTAENNWKNEALDIIANWTGDINEIVGRLECMNIKDQDEGLITLDAEETATYFIRDKDVYGYEMIAIDFDAETKKLNYFEAFPEESTESDEKLPSISVSINMKLSKGKRENNPKGSPEEMDELIAQLKKNIPTGME